ncbi:hypothetical protein F8S20_40770 [Nostoc sp. BAE]|nr:hypothetical protein [Nostoc commune BAE]
MKDMGEFDFLWNQLKLISDEDYNKLVTNGCKAEKGDILFSKDGTIGRVILFSCDRDLVLLSSIAILRPKPEIPGIYLWVFLRQSSTKEIINGGYVSGSALPRVILKDLKKLPIVKPPNQLLRRFSNIVEPIFLKIMFNELESYSLASIRDTLLPKLLSGEIRIKEAEKIAAKAM